MKIYLDNCCFNRPFDDQSGIRVHLETQAKLFIQSKIKAGDYSLVWSYVLDYENSRNPFAEKRAAISPWRYIASEIVMENDDIIACAEALERKGIHTYDALHIACAVNAKCEFYLTTDRKLLNKDIKDICVVSPIDFVERTEG